MPVENWALQQVIAAIAPQLPYWRTMVQVLPDSKVSIEGYSLDCRCILLFSAGSPGDVMANSDTDPASSGIGRWESDCELHMLLAPDGEAVLHIKPAAQTLGELRHWNHPVIALYEAGADLSDGWDQIQDAVARALEVHGEDAPAAEEDVAE